MKKHKITQKKKYMVRVTLSSVIIFLFGFASFLYALPVQEAQDSLHKLYGEVLPGKQITTNKKKISLNEEQVPLLLVLKHVAKKAKVGISYLDDMIPDKKITVHLDNVPIYQALRTILKGTQLQVVLPKSRDVLVIKRKQVKTDVRRETVTGTVTDAKTGNPLIGVNILVTGTSSGTTTNVDGHYSLNVPQLQDSLRFSYIGYQTQIVPINGRTTVNISLQPMALQLGEMVVVGYGTQKQGELTGSVSSIDMGEASNPTSSSAADALQGKIAGVRVVKAGGGKPGGGLNIHVRGIGTINSQSPLYIINGVPVQPSPNGQLGTAGILNTLDPNSIESITVLKDASSAAIYGARASGGVVIIKTKQGSKGPVRVDISASHGVQYQPGRYDVLNADEYADYIRDLHSGPNGGIVPDQFKNGQHPPYNTNWQNAIFRPAPVQNYHINISGGGENATYSVGLGYYNEKGTIIGSGFKRYSLQTNMQYNVNDNIEVGGSLMLGKADTRQDGGVASSRLPLEAATRQAPTLPIYDPSFVGGYAWPASGGQDANNPVGYSDLYSNSVFQYSAVGSLYGSVNFLKNFTYKVRLGFDYGDRRNPTYNPRYEGTYALMINSSRSLSQTEHLNPLAVQTIKFAKTFGKSDLTVMGGFTVQSYSTYGISGSGSALPTGVKSLGSASQSQTVNSSTYQHSLRSILGRITYSYDNKYLLTANIRRDESSKLFNSAEPVGVFPSVSVGWRVSEEPFLAGSHLISNLKIRAGWGQIGNQSVLSNYPTATFLNTQYYYVLNNKIVQGIGPHQQANPNITWETNTETDIGADIGLLDNKVSLTVDYYYRKTEGLLWQAQVPLSVGLLPSFINAGTIVNKGVEFSVDYNQSFGDFSFEISGNIATISNKVTSLGQNNNLEIRAGGIWDLNNISITKVGHPVGQFYGYVTDGIFQSWDDVYSWARQNQDPNGGRDAATASTHTAPGDFRFKDLSGDGVINSEDMTIIGNPIPDFTYGSTVKLGYKNVYLKVFIDGSYGNDVFFGPLEWLMDLRQNFNQGQIALDRWTPQNHSTKVPRANPNNPNNNMTRVSDRYVKNGSYMRVKTLTVGYNFSPDLINTIGARNLRIFVTARNLLTITPYPGLEPVVGSQATGTALDAGIDNYVYPQNKQFMIGLKIGF